MIIWKHKHELIDEVCVIFENKYCLFNNLVFPGPPGSFGGGGEGILKHQFLFSNNSRYVSFHEYMCFGSDFICRCVTHITN